MIAPAAWALTPVSSSLRSDTSSLIAPTSTALSLPSKGKLRKTKQNVLFRYMAHSLVGEGWFLGPIVEPILVTFDQMQNFRIYLDKYFKALA